jgi:hypothetical protein
MVSDGFVERREKKLMRRREDDKMAAGFKVACGGRDLAGVVLDMLEHVNVNDRVEILIRWQLGYRLADNFAAGGQLAVRDPPADKPGHFGIGLEAYPPFFASRAQRFGRSSDTRAYLKYSLSKVRRYQPAVIILPVSGVAKQFELIANVFEVH